MPKEKKELIRDAAITIMARFGFYNTKASQIAEEAGVAVGTIYNYFENKEDILDYIFQVELKKRLGYLEDIKKENRNFWESLEIFLNKHFKEIVDNPDLGKILVKEKEFPRKEGSASDYLHKIPLCLEELILKGIKNNDIRECRAELVASMLFGTIQGIVERAVNENNPGLLDGASVEIINIYKQGLGK